MAKIFVSLAGEGRGHATRVRALVEMLRGRHEVVVFASHVAYQLLAAAYRGQPNVSVRRIPGLEFAYRGTQLSYFRSLWRAVPFLANLPGVVRSLAAEIERERPDLAIVDFEPVLPRAARRCGLPFLSFDHQHFLVVSDLSGLPRPLRWQARLSGLPVGLFCRGQRETIVSSFFRLPLKRRWRDVRQVGVLLRPEVLAATPAVGEHLLVYLRRFARPNVLQALRDCGRPVRVYGLGCRPDEGRLEYRDIDERAFLHDLATCDALICTAGNQLVGEALFLQKPVLALPEPGNFEQALNGHFLRSSGGGDSISCRQLDAAHLRQFVAAVPRLRSQICAESLNGNPQALRAIERFLPAAERSVGEPVVERAA